MKSAVALVEETLAPADYGRVLARTRVRRAKFARVGQLDNEEREEKEDPEIFDDTDFYQQLLRDVIDSRSGGGGASAEDWVAMQKQKKAKKRVDTKASKGRKLRWVTLSPGFHLCHINY